MAMQGQKKKVGDILIEAGIVDRFQLQAALAEQRKWGGRLGKHLVQMGILTDELLVKALSTQLRMPNLDLERLEDISSDVIDLVPRGVAEKFHLVRAQQFAHSRLPYAVRITGSTPLVVMRRIIRRSLGSKSARACTEHRLSHIINSPTFQACS